jgi:Protein of unknown function (DUF2442)
VTSFQFVGPYTLRVQFDDQTEQVIDFEPVLAGELYRPLRESAQFHQVRIDAEVHTLVWPNGADFDPATLHDWPKQAASSCDAGASVGTDGCSSSLTAMRLKSVGHLFPSASNHHQFS